MWSQILLCLLVGFAYASDNPAWKDNTEYKYDVRGRTLASLHQVGDQYSGVFLKAKLSIRTRSDGMLQGKILDPQVAQVHTKLPDGWRTYIPDAQLNYKQLPISRRPFNIQMRYGVAKDLTVSKQISNWEVNFIRGIVSQFQLDTNGDYMINDGINVRSEEGSSSAVYKSMEDTVTGITETTYDIHPLPEYILQSQPWLAPQPKLKGDGEVIEIVKSKNYNNSEERPSYHYGYFEMGNDFEPTANHIGQYFSRASESRAVVTGKLNRYTIQNSYTVDEISMSPTFADKQRGAVNTIVNVTLESVDPNSQDFEEIPNYVSVGSLVYRYDSPFAASNEPRPGKKYQGPNYQKFPGSSANDESASSEELSNQSRHKRSDSQYQPQYYSDESTEADTYYWQQPQPKLNEPPQSPLLPFTVGYAGQSIKKPQNIVQVARKLAQAIGQDLQHPNEIPQKNTGGKFVTLASLTRLMNDKEVQETASALYNAEHNGANRDSWIAFRDAVAQAGTGPALLTIQNWIKSKKIQPREAAYAVAVAASFARQPTEEYIRYYFQMVQNPEFMNQQYLNESLLLSFTSLVHRVYANKLELHNGYPVHSFGSFRTANGISLMRKEIIPYLSKKLDESIKQADTEKIHVYIRALGNVGDHGILAAFEPYLEGKKQASQFQRLLMVAALDELVRSHPAAARHVLYRIYQNLGDHEQVRVAAVYQLMRTDPPVEVLQRMAKYTNEDHNEHVNAAVKYAIESAAKLRGAEFAHLSAAAQSAKSHLTKNEYGAQHSLNHFRSYVVEQMEFAYKQSAQSYGGEDSFLPKGLRYGLHQTRQGVKQHFITMQAVVSSIDDLVQSLAQQTEEYRKNQQKTDQNQQPPEEMKWSSETVAKLLGMKGDYAEQLEGSYYLKMGELQDYLGFDNRTIERLPEVVRKIEETLQNGQRYHHTKMMIANEMAIAFPTEAGWSFIYTYDKPVIYSADGRVQARATPQVSSSNRLNLPDSIEGDYEIRYLVSAKTQSQFGFITPYDSQRYSAGYDKNFQVHAPIHGRFEADIKNMQLKADVKSLEPESETELGHFSTWPYTSQEPIYTSEHQRHVIRSENPQQINVVVGQYSTGIALRLHAINDRHMDARYLYKKLQSHDAVSALLSPWVDENIQYSLYSATIDRQSSSATGINVHIGYQHRYKSAKEEEGDQNEGNINDFIKKVSKDPLKRQREFMQKAAAGIYSTYALAVEAGVEFQAPKPIKYRATASFARSDVDPKSRFIVHVVKSDNGDNSKSYEVALSCKNSFPNTNGLDLTYAMQFNPTSSSEINAYAGENYDRAAKFDAQVQYKKSEGRKHYLKQQPMYHECQQQMKEGNHQLPACANMTVRANFLDHVTIKVDYKNMNNDIFNQTYQLYNAIRHYAYPNAEENYNPAAGTGKDQVNIEARYNEELQKANFSIQAKSVNVHINNMEVGPWSKQLFVPHPVFHAKARIMGFALGYDAYRPFCVADKSAVSTFDRKTYPTHLESDWTTMLFYAPKKPQPDQKASYQQHDFEQQLKHQQENYAVYVRSNQGNSAKKDVKISYRSPKTEAKYVEVTITPSSAPQQLPKVSVNKQETKYSTQMSTDMFRDSLRIYGLPNGEAKVELADAFYVIYDGSRAKLTIVNGKFRDSVRGICGNFDGEQETDYKSPRDCILSNSQDFVDSYTVSQSGAPNSRIDNAKADSQNGECYQKQVIYANVISASTRPHGKSALRSSFAAHQCTQHQTRYEVNDDGICFTLHPLPTCTKSCQAHGVTWKTIPVHCVKSSNVSLLWKAQIDKGASPDFSLKSETKKAKMAIPTRCMPY